MGFSSWPLLTSTISQRLEPFPAWRRPPPASVWPKYSSSLQRLPRELSFEGLPSDILNLELWQSDSMLLVFGHEECGCLFGVTDIAVCYGIPCSMQRIMPIVGVDRVRALGFSRSFINRYTGMWYRSIDIDNRSHSQTSIPAYRQSIG